MSSQTGQPTIQEIRETLKEIKAANPIAIEGELKALRVIRDATELYNLTTEEKFDLFYGSFWNA